MNLLAAAKISPEALRSAAEASQADPITLPVAKQVLDEIAFLEEE